MKKNYLQKRKLFNRQFLILILITLFSTSQIFSQKNNFNYKQAAKKEKANYHTIVKNTRAKFAAKDLTQLKNKKANKQFERWAYHWQNKINEDGTFPNENLGYFNAGILDKDGKIIQPKYVAKNQSPSGEPWKNIGPEQSELDNNGYSNFPQMGRLNTYLRIAHPSDETKDVLFVGAPNGGIWKSTDGGATWAPKLDFIAGIGITDIKTTPDADFSNYTTKPIYVSTGDYDGEHVKSIGVLKSTDGGETYNSTGLSFSISQQTTLGNLVVIDENTIFVGTEMGISKTIDGGTNWTEVFNAGFNGMNFGRVAISGNKIMYTSASNAEVYTNDYTDDTNWKLTQNVAANDKKAVTVGEDGNFYTQDVQGQIKMFDGTSYTNVGTIPPGYNSQGGYNQALVVTNDIILSGEFNGQSSSDNGVTWARTLNGYYGPGPEEQTGTNLDGVYVHSDHHKMGRLDNGLRFWSVNDGGLNYITFPSATSTIPTTEYKSSKVKVTQSYSISINPTAKDGAAIMSNQDNDAFSKKDGTWYAVAQGDGIQSAINYNNPNIRYAGGQSGSILQTDSGFEGQLQGNGNSVQIGGLPTNTNFYYPLEMHKTDPNIIYAGGDDVYKIDASTGLTIAATNTGLTGKVLSIATHGNTLFATAGNKIRYSSTKAASWSQISVPNDAVGNITSIDYDATKNATFYLTYSGYTAGKKIYKTVNGGNVYKNISGDLPNVVVNEIILKQNQSQEYLFAATEIGVYFSSNEGVNWKRLGNNLPYANVKDVEIHYTEDKLIAGTFGRGLWEISIANPVLGVEDTIDNSLSLAIYPNLLKTGNLKITTKNDIKNLNYVIYNVVGGVVKKGSLDNSKEINVNSLANNVYIIRIFNQEYSSTKKFVLAK